MDQQHIMAVNDTHAKNINDVASAMVNATRSMLPSTQRKEYVCKKKGIIYDVGGTLKYFPHFDAVIHAHTQSGNILHGDRQ